MAGLPPPSPGSSAIARPLGSEHQADAGGGHWLLWILLAISSGMRLETTEVTAAATLPEARPA